MAQELSGYESDFARDGPPAPEGRHHRQGRQTPGMRQYQQKSDAKNASRIRNAAQKEQANQPAEEAASLSLDEGPQRLSASSSQGYVQSPAAAMPVVPQPARLVSQYRPEALEGLYAQYGLSGADNSAQGAQGEFHFANQHDYNEETPQSVFFDSLALNGPLLATSTVSPNLVTDHRSPSGLLVTRAAGHLPQGYQAQPVEPLQDNDRLVNTAITPVPAATSEAATSVPTTCNSDNVADLGSESEGHSDTRPKKRARVRASRSAKDLDEIRQKILSSAYNYIRARVACIDAYPDLHTTNSICADAFVCAFNALAATGVDLHGVTPDPTVRETTLLRDRFSQHRSMLRDPARAAFDEHCKGFTATLPTNTNKVNANKALYQRLILPARKPLFLYEVQDEQARSGFFRAPVIQTIINKTWFMHTEDLGINHHDLFEAENGGLATEVIALAATAARFALDEWKGGFRRAGKDALVFGIRAYRKVYRSMIKCIQEWEDAAATLGGPNLVTDLRKAMLNNAREHAGVIVEGDVVENADASDGVMQYTAADFGPEDFM